MQHESVDCISFYFLFTITLHFVSSHDILDPNLDETFISFFFFFLVLAFFKFITLSLIFENWFYDKVWI